MISALHLSKLTNHKFFLTIWILFGVFTSFTLVILKNPTTFYITFTLSLVGASFGLGLPEFMALFADTTKDENRARLSSVILLLIFALILAFGLLMSANILLDALILAIWRLSGLIGIPLFEDSLKHKETRRKPSTVSPLKNRAVLLYLIPWYTFSLVNYLSWSICSRIYGEDFISSSVLLSGIISGIFAIIAGFLADSIGRKRTLIAGFISFGIGYAVLGINPFSIQAWYLYTVLDGISWGILGVIFYLRYGVISQMENQVRSIMPLVFALRDFRFSTSDVRSFYSRGCAFICHSLFCRVLLVFGYFPFDVCS